MESGASLLQVASRDRTKVVSAAKAGLAHSGVGGLPQNSSPEGVTLRCFPRALVRVDMNMLITAVPGDAAPGGGGVCPAPVLPLEGYLRLAAGWTRERELTGFPNLLILVPEGEREGEVAGVRDGAVADLTYEEPFASLLGSHNAQIVVLKDRCANHSASSALAEPALFLKSNRLGGDQIRPLGPPRTV